MSECSWFCPRMSENSMESEWVKTEISDARRREVIEKRRILFPISIVPYERIESWECFDADIGKDSAREVREYYIPDFSQWRNDGSFSASLARLISDLTIFPNIPLASE